MGLAVLSPSSNHYQSSIPHMSPQRLTINNTMTMVLTEITIMNAVVSTEHCEHWKERYLKLKNADMLVFLESEVEVLKSELSSIKLTAFTVDMTCFMTFGFFHHIFNKSWVSANCTEETMHGYHSLSIIIHMYVGSLLTLIITNNQWSWMIMDNQHCQTID